jgi:uncharacterized repeat protein (TIGR02543 family)
MSRNTAKEAADMKRQVLAGLFFPLLILIGFGSCDFLIGPDEPVNGGGNLVISLGAGAGRMAATGADLTEDVLAALRYEVTLTGPGGEVFEETVRGRETVNLTAALGEWRIAAKAYKEDGLAGTGNLEFTIIPGHNVVWVPMEINGGYFDIAVDTSLSNGTVTADYDAAFPETTITLTVEPEAGYVLKEGTLKYNDTLIDGLPYTFAMPAANVRVSADFEALPPDTYTVTFEADGGTPAPAVQTVAEGGTVMEPAAMTKAGYNFGGWFKEAALTNSWVFATDTVTGDITLYAKWSTVTYTVTFEADGGTPVPTVQTVVEGGTVTEPAAPVKAGYNFGGWFKEVALTSPWVFATDTVTAAITLYAKWNIYSYTVTFNSNGEDTAASPASKIVVSPDTTVGTLPTPPSKTGYVFNGWNTAVDGTGSAFTDSTSVSGDLTLYARWIPFKMVSVSGDLTFPTGTDDSGTATVTNAYEIGETEVTYELWHTVRSWAEANGYTFYDNPGREGSSGSSQNTTPGANRQEPVTMVTWFDAVVWLNALTEWVNAKTGSNLTPVYYYQSAYTTVAKNSNPSSNFEKEDDSHSYASAYMKAGANGFRLPTSNEWELAARWRGSDTVNVVNNATFTTAPWFTTGNSASGATANYNNAPASAAVAWYGGSSAGVTKTQAVKGKAANGLGLYDMSGNVFEWCNDYRYTAGSNRIIRGGSWSITAGFLRVGFVYYFYPDSRYFYYGFRPARTAQ